MVDEKISAKLLNELFDRLATRLGRNPSVDELCDFIIGSQSVRTSIWNNTYEEKN